MTGLVFDIRSVAIYGIDGFVVFDRLFVERVGRGRELMNGYGLSET